MDSNTSIDQFVHELHFDIDKVRPVDVEVDWSHAPLPYKVYRGCPCIDLSLHLSQSMPQAEVQRAKDPSIHPRSVDVDELALLFWYTYGLSQMAQVLYPPEDGNGPVTLQSLRRFVPSGGGLYPNELYAYLKVDGLTSGVYHYDVAHHRLVLLREGDFDDYLARALGHRCRVEGCFAVLFVSTVFWKNYFKYHDFAYRLQSLDAGAIIGQLFEVANRRGFSSAVYYQFLDEAVHHLLGLKEDEEAVYAVVPLSRTTRTFASRAAGFSGSTRISCPASVVTARDLIQEISALRREYTLKSQGELGNARLLALHRASVLRSTGQFPANPKPCSVDDARALRDAREVSSVPVDRPSSGPKQVVCLPDVDEPSYDFALACRKRYSPGMDFSMRTVEQAELAALLRATVARYQQHLTDLDGLHHQALPRPSLSCCLHAVEGVEDGAYEYDGSRHALSLLNPGDHRLRLQSGMSMHTVNLSQVPVIFHIAATRDYWRSALGYRGHRILHMEVGILMQQLLINGSAKGLGGHPLLGYDEALCDEVCGFDVQGQTCLLQLPMGPYRMQSRFQGPLHT